jgi:PadR family transcriptional regulator, regulatory protein PadR
MNGKITKSAKTFDLGLGVQNASPNIETENRPRVRILQHFEHAVLLSVLNLGTQAFPAEITRRLTKMLERRVSLAQVFIALERMEDRGLLSSHESDPESVQGGRRRRIFRLEASGIHALRNTAATQDRMSSDRKILDPTETTNVKRQKRVTSPA